MGERERDQPGISLWTVGGKEKDIKDPMAACLGEPGVGGEEKVGAGK